MERCRPPSNYTTARENGLSPLPPKNYGKTAVHQV